MIICHQMGREPFELVFINGALVGPTPAPLIPYHYTCTNHLELGMLRARGINARLVLPPGVQEPWEVEIAAKRAAQR